MTPPNADSWIRPWNPVLWQDCSNSTAQRPAGYLVNWAWIWMYVESYLEHYWLSWNF